MPQQIEIPDQGVIEFPDEMSEDDIKGVIQQKFYATPQSQVQTGEIAPPQIAERPSAVAVEAGQAAPVSEVAANLGEAVTELVEGIPQMAVSTAKGAFKGLKFAAGSPQQRAEVIGEALAEAVPMGRQTAQDVQSPLGTKESFRGFAQLGMMAAPALSDILFPKVGIAKSPIQERPSTLTETLGFGEKTPKVVTATNEALADLESKYVQPVPEAVAPVTAEPIQKTPEVSGIEEAKVAPEVVGTGEPLQGFERTLQEVQAMKDELKRRTMVYQSGAKEEVASLLGQPRETFYNLPYEGEGGWRETSQHVKSFQDQAEQAFHERKSEIPEFGGMSGKSKLGEIWKAYKAYADRTGEKTPLNDISIHKTEAATTAPLSPKESVTAQPLPKTTTEEVIPSASEITSPESVTQPEVRPRVGEEAPLRQQGETTEARQGIEERAQAPENVVVDPRFRVVGSRGRGEATLTSDYDLVTKLTPEEHATWVNTPEGEYPNLPQNVKEAALAGHDVFIETEKGQAWKVEPHPVDEGQVVVERVSQIEKNLLSGGKKPGATEVVTPKKPSKIGQSIEAKAVEAKLTKGFAETAGYDPLTIADQSQRATSLVQQSIPQARSIIRGEAPLPEGLRGTSLLAAMEEHLVRNPDPRLAYELANSPLTSATSAAAQELRLMAERVPDSIASKFQEIREARRAGPKLRGETTESVSAQIHKEVLKQTSKRPTWEAFVREIVC